MGIFDTAPNSIHSLHSFALEHPTPAKQTEIVLVTTLVRTMTRFMTSVRKYAYFSDCHTDWDRAVALLHRV